VSDESHAFGNPRCSTRFTNSTKPCALTANLPVCNVGDK
jgi:hypothetical protein